MMPKSFRSFAEFEREILRPQSRVGLTFEDMVEDDTFEAELDFDADDEDADSR
jgi:hypothetical protein